MIKIDCIVYSKDRAAQLDLLLRSIKDHFINMGNIFIIYTYSNMEFGKGYLKLMDRLDKELFETNISFKHQTNFKENLLSCLELSKSPFYFSLCDDDVFIKKVNCSDIVKHLEDERVNAISLKAGLNILGNYGQGVIKQPEFIETEPYLKWNWREYSIMHDWGYPTCINSYIFDKNYFYNLIKYLDFNNPPTLEGGLNTIRNRMRIYMYAFKESSLLNIPANRIQVLSPNKFDNLHEYTVENLNSVFLEGKRLSTNNIYGSHMVMGNEEREFIFE
jgi:hypothetical protein